MSTPSMIKSPGEFTFLGLTSHIKFGPEHLPKLAHFTVAVHSLEHLVRVLAQLFDLPTLSFLELVGCEVTLPLEKIVNKLVEMKAPMGKGMRRESIRFAKPAHEEKLLSTCNLHPVGVVIGLVRCLACVFVAVRVLIVALKLFQSVFVIRLSIESNLERALMAGAVASIALVIDVSMWFMY